ncbi:unnamed protein product, partial [Symbiodinium sp. KB8]
MAAVEDLATRLRPRLTDAVSLDLRHDALSETVVFFGFILGLMREQPLSSTVLCPVIYRFPGQLRGSWSATPEGQRAKACLDAGGDAMDQEKMSQLMLYTWLGAGGVDGLPWRHICSTDGLTRCDSSSEQAMAVIKFAMSYAQLRGNHVLKFFGSDGRDEGAKNGASVFFGCTRQLLQLATNLQSCNKATVPHFDGALTAREAVPYGYLKTEDTVASGVFLGLSRPAALILALHSSPPTVSVTFTTLLQGADNDAEKAEAWFDWLLAAGGSPTTVAFTALSAAAAAAGDVARAEKSRARCWELFGAEGVSKQEDEGLLRQILRACGRSSNAARAGQWTQWMVSQTLDPGRQGYTSVIAAHGQRRDADGAQSWFDEMQRAGLKADLLSWSALVTALSRSRRADEALHAVDQMQEQSVQPDGRLYQQLLKTFASGRGNPDQQRLSEKLLRRMAADSLQPGSSALSSIRPKRRGAKEPFSRSGDHIAPADDTHLRQVGAADQSLITVSLLGRMEARSYYKIYEDLSERTKGGTITSLEQWCDELAKVPLKGQPGRYWDYSYSLDVL